jgi:hypothetical protein
MRLWSRGNKQIGPGFRRSASQAPPSPDERMIVEVTMPKNKGKKKNKEKLETAEV